MSFSDYCIDMHDFSAMAPPQFWFGSEPTASPFPTHQPAAAAASPEVEAAAKCADERRLRRRILNRESSSRSRARKQHRLDELRDSVSVLEPRRRELAARAQDALGRLALVRQDNAKLRAEAAALSRRLAAARRALALGLVDIEQTIASLIA